MNPLKYSAVACGLVWLSLLILFLAIGINNNGLKRLSVILLGLGLTLVGLLFIVMAIFSKDTL